MKRASLVFLVFAAGCHPAATGRIAEWECAAAPGAVKRLVLTSFQPLYSLASTVVEGSPCLEVVNLAPRARGPHDFDLDDPAQAGRCRDLARRAEAVVTLRSLPLAPAFDRLYPWCRRENIRIVEIDPAAAWDPAAPGLPLIPNPADSARAREAAREGAPVRDAAPNPHVWLSLTHAAQLAEGIARDEAALDPDHAALYRANAARLARALRGLKAAYEKRFAEIESLRVVALTEGFPYLTADFGIDVADYILSPKGPREIAERVRAAGVKAALAEEPPAPDVARAVEEAGAAVVVLTTIEEGWGEGESLDPDGYLKAMRENLERLHRALR